MSKQGGSLEYEYQSDFESARHEEIDYSKEDNMNLIVAVDNNWAIGSKNELLIRIPNDHKHSVRRPPVRWSFWDVRP